tara:strand:- start:1242 stop:1871 length:630 start_codon:yes stop_codon:yes gene_type:complete
MSNNPFQYAVWHNLSEINVSEHIEKKGNLSYLSWTWAWQTLMDIYPCSHFVFDEPTIYPDGSVEVHCTVTVTCSSDAEKSVTRSMFLPVMDNRNNAICNPNARQISDTKMRTLVKCIALHGLGMYIYAGSDLPEAEAAELKKPLTGEQVDNLIALLEASGTDYDQFLRHFKIANFSEMTAGQYQNALSILEKKMQKLEAEKVETENESD